MPVLPDKYYVQGRQNQVIFGLSIDTVEALKCYT
jgi:hypothetical protein